MSRKTRLQMPHYGKSRSLTRKGKTISGSEARVCESISRAKRFMRTGKESRE